MVTQILEGVRRFTAKQGREINLALPPLNYGGHPYHHIGMPGTVNMPSGSCCRNNDIYDVRALERWVQKDNHSKQHQLWMLETAIQEFCKRFQLPGIFRVLDWHRAVREFFVPNNKPDSLDTTFVHADECETSVALLLFKDMIDMSAAQDKWGESYLPDGHFDKSVDPPPAAPLERR